MNVVFQLTTNYDSKKLKQMTQIIFVLKKIIFWLLTCFYFIKYALIVQLLLSNNLALKKQQGLFEIQTAR